MQTRWPEMHPLKAANKILTLWQAYGPDTYPVDLRAVVDEVVNKSAGNDRLSLATELLSEADGAMVRSRVNKNEFAAIVNSGVRNARRRRFTMAHEIGHFVLHRSAYDDFLCTRNMLEDFKTEGIEKEANEFAAQLLMPPNRVKDFDAKPWTVDTLKEIAEFFEVSLQAAGLRMAQLSSRKRAFVVSVSDFVEWGVSSNKLFKTGCYFKQLMEVPGGSTAHGAELSHELLDAPTDLNDLWGIDGKFTEESTLGFNDRIYTCIDAGS